MGDGWCGWRRFISACVLCGICTDNEVYVSIKCKTSWGECFGLFESIKIERVVPSLSLGYFELLNFWAAGDCKCKALRLLYNFCVTVYGGCIIFINYQLKNLLNICTMHITTTYPEFHIWKLFLFVGWRVQINFIVSSVSSEMAPVRHFFGDMCLNQRLNINARMT